MMKVKGVPRRAFSCGRSWDSVEVARVRLRVKSDNAVLLVNARRRNGGVVNKILADRFGTGEGNEENINAQSKKRVGAVCQGR